LVPVEEGVSLEDVWVPPPFGLLGELPVAGDSVGLVAGDSVGPVTGVLGEDPLDELDTPTLGVETFTLGVDTLTPGTVTVTLGTVTVTLGTDTEVSPSNGTFGREMFGRDSSPFA
jgi:hypothetical protein